MFLKLLLLSVVVVSVWFLLFCVVLLQCQSPLTILLGVVSTLLIFLKLFLLSVVVVVSGVVLQCQSPLTNLAILCNW